MDGPHADFDWNAVETLLGEVRQEVGAERFAELSEGLTRLAQWCFPNRPLVPGDDVNIGRNFMCLMWIVCPGLLEGASLDRIAEVLGVTRQALSRRTSEASRQFGIKNRGQWAHAHKEDQP